MIENIIENFNWGKVLVAMEELRWTWYFKDGPSRLPTKVDLKLAAQDRMESAIRQALNPNNKEHKDIGWISSSGGLKATAYRTKKYKLDMIYLEFVLEEWFVEKD